MDLQRVLEQRAKVEEFTRRHRIGLLTLLFTDLVGSTKLKQELGDREAVGLIQRHHALVREILSGFKAGEEIGTAGDSFFIVFTKPSDAAQFSLMLQNRLRCEAQQMNCPLLDRVGIHIGEVIVEERAESTKPKDLYGLQVDICARVMSLAEGDQILLTRAAFDNARQVLKGQDIERVGNLSWLNHGPYLLKGVEEPLEICEVGEMNAAVLKPPPDSEKVHRHVSPDVEPVLGWRPALGQVVPNTQWLLEEKLGEGGFGEVWLGTHQTLKERRVFKFCFRADRVRPLKREVTLFRLLKERIGEHPNIARMHDAFFDEPPYYLMMDYVEGRDLVIWCEVHGGVEKVPTTVKLEIVAQVAEALQRAHEAGVIHRDVKPSNILVSGSGSASDEVRVKLTDFGIGQVTSKDQLAGLTLLGFTHTMAGPQDPLQAGTYVYMAPERLVGAEASNRSDIYSLGVVLYQLLTNDLRRPLTLDWDKNLVGSGLRSTLARCFAGDPKERFEKARQLVEELRFLQRFMVPRIVEASPGSIDSENRMTLHNGSFAVAFAMSSRRRHSLAFGCYFLNLAMLFGVLVLLNKERGAATFDDQSIYLWLPLAISTATLALVSLALPLPKVSPVIPFFQNERDLVLCPFDHSDSEPQKEIPPRGADCEPSLIDLTSFYTDSLNHTWYGGVAGNHLASLGTDARNLGGIRFDVRGLVQLSSLHTNQVRFPKEIKGIPVRSKLDRIHFLHAAVHGRGRRGTQIGQYVVHFAYGVERVLPIVIGKHCLDWWDDEELDDRENSEVAWVGANEVVPVVRLFKTVWENPDREILVESIDFTSSMNEPAPFLIAITIESMQVECD